MFALPPALGTAPEAPLRVVALGAHADDLEIGAGGTVLRLLAERPYTHVWWAVASGDASRADEARAAAAEMLAGAAHAHVLLGRLPDGRFPTHADALRTWIREALQPAAPHFVLTHRLSDAHQDHRAVAEASWQAFRGATIAAYEIPKWESDAGPMNAFVALSEAQLARKVDVLARCFPSQAAKPWYDAEAFRGLARLRGVQAGVRWAEAFECTKLVW